MQARWLVGLVAGLLLNERVFQLLAPGPEAVALVELEQAGLVQGGAHGNPSTSGLNIDTKTGRKLAFADGFDKAAQEKLTAACMSQIASEKVKRGMDEPKGDELKSLRKGVDEGLAQLDAWNFTAGRATIVYGHYAIGAYAEGAYECDVPLATLKALARKDFPLPD